MSSEVSSVKRYDFQSYPTEQGFFCVLQDIVKSMFVHALAIGYT